MCCLKEKVSFTITQVYVYESASNCSKLFFEFRGAQGHTTFNLSFRVNQQLNENKFFTKSRKIYCRAKLVLDVYNTSITQLFYKQNFDSNHEGV